jgi:hypothetical protein
MAQDEGKEVSLRDTLTEAFDSAETPETPTTEAKETPPVEEVKDVTPEATQETPAKTETKPETPKTTTGRKQGRDGKFLPKEEPKEEAKDDPKLPKSRAPGTWTAGAREKWNGLPPEIQREVLRRERDIANGFSEIGRIRQFGQMMQETWAPFQGIIAAEGGNAVKVTRDLFSTAAALYSGTPQQKVDTVAQMIKVFGVDIRMLDNTLSGVVGSHQQPQPVDIQQHVNTAVQKALAPVYQERQQTQKQMEAEAYGEIDAFANDAKNEFFPDVRETMADLLEVASKQGKTMDLQTAYNRAILMHGDIADVIQERSLKEKAARASQTAAAARKKAVSVTGAPAKESVTSQETASLRDDILGAIDSLGT